MIKNEGNSLYVTTFLYCPWRNRISKTTIKTAYIIWKEKHNLRVREPWFFFFVSLDQKKSLFLLGNKSGKDPPLAMCIRSCNFCTCGLRWKGSSFMVVEMPLILYILLLYFHFSFFFNDHEYQQVNFISLLADSNYKKYWICQTGPFYKDRLILYIQNLNFRLYT